MTAKRLGEILQTLRNHASNERTAGQRSGKTSQAEIDLREAVEILENLPFENFPAVKAAETDKGQHFNNCEKSY